MKLQLKRVAPVQAGKMIGGLYGLFALLAVPFILLFMGFGAFAARVQGGSAPALPLVLGMGAGFIVCLPIVYAVMGFVFGCVAALIYNLLAKSLGGFELDFESKEPPAV